MNKKLEGLEAWLPKEELEEYNKLSKLEKLCYEPKPFFGVDRGAFYSHVETLMGESFIKLQHDLIFGDLCNGEDE